MLPKGEVPGLAMGLGGVGISLADLTMLYAGLARGGDAIALTERRDPLAAPAQRRLLDPVAAWYVGNVLIGTPPPENAAGGRIAFKTGTSYGYRDAWTVGFDGRRTVGVWVGRPDGAPVPGLVGRSRRGADPVRRLRAPRQPAGGAAESPEGRDRRRQQPPAASAAALRAPERERSRYRRRASCSRRTARGSPPKAPKWR